MIEVESSELTFISTPLIIGDATEDLVDIPLLDTNRTVHGSVRRLIVKESIANVLQEQLLFDRSPYPRFRALVTKYQLGWSIRVSLHGNSEARPDFERLDDCDEVWVMCFRDPRLNQWRLFGRFIQHNVFVGLYLYDRRALGTREHYNIVAQNFPNQWDVETKMMPYITGTTVGQYLGGVTIDVDQSAF